MKKAKKELFPEQRWDEDEIENNVPHICSTCEFNFGEICTAHDSLYGYGGKITNEEATCNHWGISLDSYLEEVKRY